MLISSDTREALMSNTIAKLPKRLLRRGGVYGKTGKTLLHLAAKYSSDCSVLSFCVNNLKVKPQTATKNKRLPIHVSCIYGKLEFTQALIRFNESCINKKDKDGETPLSLACRNKHTEIALYLINCSANPNTVDKHDWTPLHWASKNGDTLLVEKLISHGADPKVKTSNGITTLHLAVESGNVNTVSLLLPIVNVMSISHNNQTILHYSNKNPEMINFLIKNTQWFTFPKLGILLDIDAPVNVILENCSYEFQGKYLYILMLFDRADVICQLYSRRITNLKELKQENINSNNPKCRALIQYLTRWDQIGKILFLYKFSGNNGFIKRLHLGLLREIVNLL
jgi:Ankyrin repeats (3 copies)